MTEKERISQLEELTAESLRKLDIVIGDVEAIRTAQLRTMHIVAGNTEAIGFILDKVDTIEGKVDTIEGKIEELKVEISAIRTDLTTKQDEMRADLAVRFDLLMAAVQDLKK